MITNTPAGFRIRKTSSNARLTSKTCSKVSMQRTVPAEASGKLIAETSSTRSTPGPSSHVAADVGLAGEHSPQVGVAFLPLDLKRAELIHRGRTIKGLGHKAAECLVVVSHRRRSSLSRAAG